MKINTFRLIGPKNYSLKNASRCFWLMAVTLLVFLYFAPSPAKGIEQPLIKNGVLDLRNWDFERDGLLELKGKAEFYWKQLLVPEDFIPLNNHAELTGYMQIPGLWNDFILFRHPAERDNE